MSAQLISIAPSEEVDFDELLASILKKICESTDWEYGEAWLPESKGNLLKLSPICYINTEKLEERLSLEQFFYCSQGFVIRPGEGLPGRVWKSRKSEWLFDAIIDSETYFLRNQIARAFGVRSGWGIPLIVNDKIRAIFVLFMKKTCLADKKLIEKTEQIVEEIKLLLAESLH